ncbi:MAG: DNA-binding protein [Candidatus Nanopelagicales bacterium]
MTDRSGAFHRVLSGLSRSKADLHAEKLRTGSRELGATPISECVPGEPATIVGVLNSVTLRPREGVPAVEAELHDGSGRLIVVWLGRRQIRGIEPGREILVRGRLTGHHPRPVIFNPRYELRPGPHS